MLNNFIDEVHDFKDEYYDLPLRIISNIFCGGILLSRGLRFALEVSLSKNLLLCAIGLDKPIYCIVIPSEFILIGPPTISDIYSSTHSLDYNFIKNFKDVKIINIESKDKYIQAISLYLAKTLKIFKVTSDHELNLINSFNVKNINDAVQKIQSLETFIIKNTIKQKEFITKNNIPYKNIYYEDLIKDYDECVKNCMSFLFNINNIEDKRFLKPRIDIREQASKKIMEIYDLLKSTNI